MVGSSCRELSVLGSSCRELSVLGSSCCELSVLGSSCRELSVLGSSCCELSVLGSSCCELSVVGSRCRELSVVGLSCRELNLVGLSCRELSVVFSSCCELIVVGSSCRELSVVCSSCRKLNVVGSTCQKLSEVKYSWRSELLCQNVAKRLDILFAIVWVAVSRHISNAVPVVHSTFFSISSESEPGVRRVTITTFVSYYTKSYTCPFARINCVILHGIKPFSVAKALKRGVFYQRLPCASGYRGNNIKKKFQYSFRIQIKA